MESILTMSIYIVVSLAVMAIMAFIYLRWGRGEMATLFESQRDIDRRAQIASTIRWLYRSVNDICRQCGMEPQYEILDTAQITYTDKIEKSHTGVIHLAIWDDRNGAPFSANTLMYSVLHELAHILSPSRGHAPPFDAIETLLLTTATEMGYYDPRVPIDAGYITLDLPVVPSPPTPNLNRSKKKY